MTSTCKKWLLFTKDSHYVGYSLYIVHIPGYCMMGSSRGAFGWASKSIGVVYHSLESLLTNNSSSSQMGADFLVELPSSFLLRVECQVNLLAATSDPIVHSGLTNTFLSISNNNIWYVQRRTLL